MKVKPFRSIGGLTLHTFDPDQAEYGHGNVMMQIPRDNLSLLAVEAIREIGMDASEDLILTCRQMIDSIDRQKADVGTPPWRTLRPELQSLLADLQMEDIRDSLKECAHEELDRIELEDLAVQIICTEQDDDPTKEQIAAWIKENQMVEPGDDELYIILESIRDKRMIMDNLLDPETGSTGMHDWVTARGYVLGQDLLTPEGKDWMKNREAHYEQENQDDA